MGVVNEPHFDSTEKRVSLVYNSDISGFQALDFSKVNDIEKILLGTHDAFGRVRISPQFTLADYAHVYGNGPTELLSKTSGTLADITLNGQQAKATLTAGTASGGFAIHQSRKYHYYRPGKSQLIFSSFNFKGAGEGSNKRIGYFDDYNGIYVQQSGDGTLQIVLRGDVSGSVQEEIIPQTSWNIDTCNGSGASKFNIDTTKTQLFFADFQWLGVGRVRAGFVHNGETIIAHEFYNSNNKDTVYWRNPSLPIRCEMRNYSTVAVPNTMDQICSTVISEGGGGEVGFDFNVRTTGARTLSASSSLPLLAIKMKTGYNGFQNRAFNTLEQVSVVSEDQNVAWEVWRLPNSSAISGGSWISANNESATEYNISASGFNLSGGYRFSSDFILAGGLGAGQYQGLSSVEAPSQSRQNYIAQNIEGTDSNVYALLVYNLTASPTDCFASMQWREVK